MPTTQTMSPPPLAEILPPTLQTNMVSPKSSSLTTSLLRLTGPNQRMNTSSLTWSSTRPTPRTNTISPTLNSLMSLSLHSTRFANFFIMLLSLFYLLLVGWLDVFTPEIYLYSLPIESTWIQWCFPLHFVLSAAVFKSIFQISMLENLSWKTSWMIWYRLKTYNLNG